MTPRRHGYSRALARAAALVVVVATSAAVLPAQASAEAVATVVCWKRLINDWYDGRIDQAYPVRCYREAIKNLPEDVDVYSSAREDIQRALLGAIRDSKRKTGTEPTEATPVKPPPKKRESNAPPAAGPRDPDDESGIDSVAIGDSNNADSVPLPLIVLAVLAMLLLAAAAAGVVTRRLQARRVSGDDEPPTIQ